MSSESFVTSDWNLYFKKDLEQSSAIVFIGYSLYDIDIEKILFSSSSVFKKKIYFITKKDPSEKELYILSKYGLVLPIGVDTFGNSINEISTSDESHEFWLDAFSEYSIKDAEHNISDDQILHFVQYGQLDQEYIDNGISAIQTKPYLIIREQIDEVVNLLSVKSFVSIIAELGNGKSVFLRELMSYFSMQGKKVFILENLDSDYVSDLEKIHNLQTQSIVIIDNYTLNFDVVLHISQFCSSNIVTIISDRSNNHDRFRKKIIDSKIDSHEINIDKLNSSEINNFIDIITNLGFWGERASWGKAKKEKFILEENKSQISHTLLSIFNSPQIINRIKDLFHYVSGNNEYKDTVFAICLLEVLGLPTNFSLISTLSDNTAIYKTELRENTCFKQLFKEDGCSIISKSSLFSISFIQNAYTSSYITNKLLGLAEKFDKLRSTSDSALTLFKSLLRFSFIERILPDAGKLNSLTKYYEELKIKVNWLKFDPHYWLQYGMARMSYGHLDKAQSNLDESYALARTKEYYDTSYIDTQQARLYILKALKESDGKIVWDYFLKAHNLLNSLLDDVYKYRQVATYKSIYDKKYNILSVKDREKFKEIVLTMRQRVEVFNKDVSDSSSDYCLMSLNNIISKFNI